MTKHMIFLLIAILLSTGCKEVNHENNSKSKIGYVEEQSQSSKEEIDVVVTKFNNAMVNKDSLQLDFLTSDDLSYGHSSGLVQNKNEFIDDVLNGPFNFSIIENPNQEIKLFDDMAIVRHVFEATATNNGEPVDIRIGNMQVYKRSENGHWKLLARQAHKF